MRQGARDAVRTAESVLLPGGKGVLVQAAPGCRARAARRRAGSTVYLISAQGVRYPLGTRSGDALTALGYGGVTPLAVPASLLALVPTGPGAGAGGRAGRTSTPRRAGGRASPARRTPHAGPGAPARRPPARGGRRDAGLADPRWVDDCAA